MSKSPVIEKKILDFQIKNKKENNGQIYQDSLSTLKSILQPSPLEQLQQSYIILQEKYDKEKEEHNQTYLFNKKKQEALEKTIDQFQEDIENIDIENKANKKNIFQLQKLVNVLQNNNQKLNLNIQQNQEQKQIIMNKNQKYIDEIQVLKTKLEQDQFLLKSDFKIQIQQNINKIEEMFQKENQYISKYQQQILKLDINYKNIQQDIKQSQQLKFQNSKLQKQIQELKQQSENYQKTIKTQQKDFQDQLNQFKKQNISNEQKINRHQKQESIDLSINIVDFNQNQQMKQNQNNIQSIKSQFSNFNEEYQKLESKLRNHLDFIEQEIIDFQKLSLNETIIQINQDSQNDHLKQLKSTQILAKQNFQLFKISSQLKQILESQIQNFRDQNDQLSSQNQFLQKKLRRIDSISSTIQFKNRNNSLQQLIQQQTLTKQISEQRFQQQWQQNIAQKDKLIRDLKVQNSLFLLDRNNVQFQCNQQNKYIEELETQNEALHTILEQIQFKSVELEQKFQEQDQQIQILKKIELELTDLNNEYCYKIENLLKEFQIIDEEQSLLEEQLNISNCQKKEISENYAKLFQENQKNIQLIEQFQNYQDTLDDKIYSEGIKEKSISFQQKITSQFQDKQLDTIFSGQQLMQIKVQSNTGKKYSRVISQD